MSDLRTILERGVGAASPPPNGFERMLRRRDRKHRNQRIAAGVVGIAVFVAALLVVASGGPFDRTQAPAGEGATTGPTGSTAAPPHPVGVGLLGLPPEGATPSAPERGKLVLAFTFGHTGGDPGRFGLHVYADGRVIWQRLGDRIGGGNDFSTGLIEQRLTPEGVDLVLAEVLSTGLFDRDRDLGLAPRIHYGGVEVRDGDRVVHLTWGDAGFEKGSDPMETTPTPERVRALERLDVRLEDLSSWLPASAWEDPAFKAYVPSMYQVCYNGQDEPLERSRILDLLPAPAADVLRSLDTTQRGRFHGAFRPVPFWCSVVTTDQARGLVEILEDAAASVLDPGGPVFSFYRPNLIPVEVNIGFDPLLPHDAA
jgi:hypothetical protein